MVVGPAAAAIMKMNNAFAAFLRCGDGGRTISWVCVQIEVSVRKADVGRVLRCLLES